MNNYKTTRSLTLKLNSRWLKGLEPRLFLMMLFLEAVIFIYMIHKKCIPGGHDGFQFFFGQHYYLNNVVNNGGIPQWIPFMTHGNLMSLGYIVTGGILQNVSLLCGSLFTGLNFLPIFYVGMFIDELVLLVGVWLLGRRFVASPLSLFFISLSIMGSCIWVIQPWFNFHFYYAIPLVLHFIHMFLEHGKWRYCLFAGNLLVVQSLGNLPYFLPVTTLTVFLYFLFYIILNFHDIRRGIKRLYFGWSFIITLSLTITSFSILYITMRISVDQIVNYNFMRNSDWVVSVNPFLTYGGKSWKAWVELLIGISPCLDYTLYIGVACVPLVFLCLVFNQTKGNLHFLCVVIALLLFSMGTLVSIFFYYLWPMMKYFRHLMLISAITKMFICFLAGFGFDVLLSSRSRWRNLSEGRLSFAIMAVFLIGLFCTLRILSHNFAYCNRLIQSMVPAHLPPLRILSYDLIAVLITRTSVFAFISGCTFACLCLFNKRKHLLTAIFFLLLSHGLDIYSFKIFDIFSKTASLKGKLYGIAEFQTIPYSKKRDLSFWINNPRAEVLKILPVVEPGSVYWSTYIFLFKDQLDHTFRTDFWLLPLDNYMRAYWGQSIYDLSKKPKGLFYFTDDQFPRLEFPKEHPAVLKISGVTEDKIQFFSQADIVDSIDIIVAKITSPDYKGDTIFLSPLGKSTNVDIAKQSNDSKDDLSADKRIRLAYTVNRFDSNNLEISTNTGDLGSVWLFYSDVWHPLWEAIVNGKKAPVYKANLAYKAVKLEKGYNEVHFHFESRLMTAFQYIFGFNSLAWLLIIFYLAGKIVLNRGTGFKDRSVTLPE